MWAVYLKRIHGTENYLYLRLRPQPKARQILSVLEKPAYKNPQEIYQDKSNNWRKIEHSSTW